MKYGLKYVIINTLYIIGEAEMIITSLQTNMLIKYLHHSHIAFIAQFYALLTRECITWQCTKRTLDSVVWKHYVMDDLVILIYW